MAWNIAVLVTALLCLFLTVGVEVVTPLTDADALAEDIAPRLGVSEDQLRKELAETLNRAVGRKAAIRAMPWCLLTVLLAIRLIKDWQSEKGPVSSQKGPG